MANELTRNAINRARRKELETFQRALDIQWLNSRMDDGRMGRCLALIKKEAEMEKDFQERTDHAAIVNARAQKETALGMEIAQVRREEVNLLQRRHYLRERDPSLRELSKKLQAGYVCRDLRQQILHNEYKKLQDQAEEHHANSVLRTALFNDAEAREHEEKLKIERTSAYCKDLQQQLVNRQRQKQCQYEDTLIEKKMLDDIMRTISDEDQRELKQKREQTDKLRREMVTFKQARDAWRLKQKALTVQEEADLEKQRQAAADRSSAIVAERERQMRIKEEINAKIAAKIMADEAARQDRDNFIKLLQEQEHLEKNVQDDRAQRRKAEFTKTDTKQALTAQMDAKKRLIHEQKMRDVEFRKESEAKKALEDAKEREKERKKKEKAQKYSVELRKQIEQNAVKREKEERLEQARAQAVWDYHTAWRSEVAKEREKIVEEHVPQLLGYLQAGVIKKDDLPAVRAGANKSEELSKLDIESMATSSRPKRFSKCNAQCRILREF
ncbi:meiosis-specific nuclear structural protein 1-like [Choristoneura fumiferana]|uniref:meiosis-specific nuclear structural protein 1-like n=1 Tax=Choristoneura fumiferana TaxID=7141 RepID=UPI003D1539F6